MSLTTLPVSAGASVSDAQTTTGLRPAPSFFELLMSQTLQQPQVSPKGFRLSFNKQLVAPIDVVQYPFHYAAVTGNHLLALFLYAKGLRPGGKLFSLASFSAEGLNGETPWRHPLRALPSEAALLAGDTKAAHLLALMEQDVPLHWSHHNHSKFPEAFRKQVASMVAAVAAHPKIQQMPALTRQKIIYNLATRGSRADVWQVEDRRVWEDCWQELLGTTLYEHGLKLLPSPEAVSHSAEQPHIEQQQRQQQQQQEQQGEFLPICYQLRLNAQPRRRFDLRSFVTKLMLMSASLVVLEATVGAVIRVHERVAKRL